MDRFNLREDKPSDVRRLMLTAKQRKEAFRKYKLLSDLIRGKVIDLNKSKQLFVALNREKLDFEELLKLHEEDARKTAEAVKQAREAHNGRWWNRNSRARWGLYGHIPNCIYYSRPPQYWKKEELVKNFFNSFPKFRISDKRI